MKHTFIVLQISFKLSRNLHVRKQDKYIVVNRRKLNFEKQRIVTVNHGRTDTTVGLHILLMFCILPRDLQANNEHITEAFQQGDPGSNSDGPPGR